MEAFWGPVTSNVDWCEPNYVHTYYIAEFYNTISSLPMTFLGLFGIYVSVYNAHLYGKRFILAFFFLFLVGVGSTLFHMTLLYEYQLLDELPMILGTFIFLFTVSDIPYNRPERTGTIYKLLSIDSLFVSSLFPFHVSGKSELRGVVLTLYGILTMITMVLYKNSPLPMNISFVGMVVFIVYRGFRIYYENSDKSLRTYYLISAVAYSVGGTCWIVEKQFCRELFFVAQYLHMLWHLLAGVGTYIFVTWTCYCHALLLDYSPMISFKFCIPYVKVSSKAA